MIIRFEMTTNLSAPLDHGDQRGLPHAGERWQLDRKASCLLGPQPPAALQELDVDRPPSVEVRRVEHGALRRQPLELCVGLVESALPRPDACQVLAYGERVAV